MAAGPTDMEPTADPTRGLLRWLATHDLPRQMVLLCSHTEVPGGESDQVLVQVPGCLADASIALPAQVLAWGVPEVAVLPCQEARAAVEARLQQWLETITNSLVRLAEPPRRRLRLRGPEVLQLEAIPVSRRALLGLGSTDGSPLDLDADETARTLHALRLLADRGMAAPTVSPAQDRLPPEPSPARQLLVDACTACGVCVRACPHDALRLLHDDGVSLLLHAQSACRGELACMEFCPVAAITDAGPIPLLQLWDEPEAELTAVASTQCPRCRTRHTGAPDSYCPTCEFRTSNVFGSALPPGFRPPAR